MYTLSWSHGSIDGIAQRDSAGTVTDWWFLLLCEPLISPAGEVSGARFLAADGRRWEVPREVVRLLCWNGQKIVASELGQAADPASFAVVPWRHVWEK